MSTLKYLLEKQLFGVCERIGERLKISGSRIRLYFIYTSFLSLGSPVIVYLVLAFWINIRHYIFEGRRSVWDL